MQFLIVKRETLGYKYIKIRICKMVILSINTTQTKSCILRDLSLQIHYVLPIKWGWMVCVRFIYNIYSFDFCFHYYKLFYFKTIFFQLC